GAQAVAPLGKYSFDISRLHRPVALVQAVQQRPSDPGTVHRTTKLGLQARRTGYRLERTSTDIHVEPDPKDGVLDLTVDDAGFGEHATDFPLLGDQIIWPLE